MGGVVSAYHALSAGTRLSGRDARPRPGRRKRGDADGLIPVTTPEVRRLLAILLLSAESQQHRLHWSHWRRQRQAEARRRHYIRRLARSIVHVPL